MRKNIQGYFSRRRKRKQEEEWSMGYAWAVGELLHTRTSAEDLEAKVSGIDSSFDAGARAALRDFGPEIDK